MFSEVQLKFASQIETTKVYQLSVNNISDCSGNKIGMLHKAKTGVPQPADSFDIVFNEILFNPKTGGYDYVELYNRSNKITDLKQLYIAGRNSIGTLANTRQLSSVPYLLFPGQYLVLTENTDWLLQNYTAKDPQTIMEIDAMPSLPDDKGIIVLTNLQGDIVEELHYNEKWHFALIDNKDGVALERINYNEPTNEKSNWTSAASTAAFGTPGYQNSQFRADLQAQGTLTVSSIFSPDNDGFEDVAEMRYQMAEPGYTANITIFDVAGRPIRHLAKNATMGITGNLRWDGLDDKSNKLPVGSYIVYTELFNLQGKTKKFRHIVVLAKKF
jgi:hypothetical protein